MLKYNIYIIKTKEYSILQKCLDFKQFQFCFDVEQPQLENSHITIVCTSIKPMWLIFKNKGELSFVLIKTHANQEATESG